MEPSLAREVSAAVNRASVGQADCVQRPTPALGHELDRGHVYAVDIGAFFAVDFDADEVLVHKCRRRTVFKSLVLHDVAPMAGAVADADDDQFVLCSGLFPNGFRPRFPVHGVVGVLAEVGAALVDEGIGGGVGRGISHGYGGLAGGQKQGKWCNHDRIKAQIQRLVQTAMHLVQFLNCRIHSKAIFGFFLTRFLA